jgi:hypothetical protein
MRRERRACAANVALTFEFEPVKIETRCAEVFRLSYDVIDIGDDPFDDDMSIPAFSLVEETDPLNFPDFPVF